MRLQDKVAIITGAASGIGRGAAELFAEHGARMVLVDRDEPGLARLVAALAERGAQALPFAGDVSAAETAAGAVALALERFGRLDVLFNNAGIMPHGDMAELDEATWERVMAVNVKSMYLLTRAALPHMLDQGRGSIVNTSSVMATLTEPGYEAYTTSKSAVLGFTRAVAVSYAERGVRCNAICPGWVDTPLNMQLAADMGGTDRLTPLIKAQQPLGRMATTREVAFAALFLASDEASAVTGSALYVDGAASAAI
jgi:NAD(P)-dependent dehydrogenase (short-subunit alcohol dehydrogenase family)